MKIKEGCDTMFGGMKKSNSSNNGEEIETIIGRNTQFKGVISGAGNIRIDGKMEGEINTSGDAVVGEEGEVVAEVKAGNVLISGTIRGNVNVNSKLEILGSGRLYGDVKAAILSISEGALFKGNSNMEPEKISEIDSLELTSKK